MQTQTDCSTARLHTRKEPETDTESQIKEEGRDSSGMGMARMGRSRGRRGRGGLVLRSSREKGHALTARAFEHVYFSAEPICYCCYIETVHNYQFAGFIGLTMSSNLLSLCAK